MSELDSIRAVLEGAARRHRLSHALRGMSLGLLLGAIGALTILAIYHLIDVPLWLVVGTALLPVCGMAIGFIWAGYRKPSLTEVARWVDGRRKLKERLS